MESLGDVLRRAQVSRVPGEEPAISAPPACPQCGGAGYFRRDLPLDDPHFGELVACDCTRRQMEQRRLASLIERSNLTNLQHLTFDSFITSKYAGSTPPPRTPEAAARQAQGYAEEPEGWLLIYGDFGTGKTHLAAAVANHRLSMGQPAVFIVVPDLLDHLRSTFSPNSEVRYDDLFETVRNTPLLILDDLGTQSSTPWAQEKLYQILNHRYNIRLPTVITTNLSPDEIEPRLRSRIGDGQLTKRCEIRDTDKRLGTRSSSVAGRRGSGTMRETDRL